MKTLLPFAVWVVSATAARVALYRRGPKPSYEVEAATTKYCVDWYDYDFQEISCSDLRDAFGITLQEWSRWVTFASSIISRAV
jgi:predicted secreted Zn-dependent protease